MSSNTKTEWERLEQRLGFYLGRMVGVPIIPPEHVYFSLTTRCNLKCTMCDIARNPSVMESELSTPLIKDIIRQVKEMRIGHVIFSGGEPFLRADLCELVEYSVSVGLKMTDIISNGTLVTDEAIKKLIKSKLNHITISMDGLRQTNDGIRGSGSFDKSQSAIERINYYKSKTKSQQPTVGINFTVMNHNIQDMVPMVGFARDHKCNIIVFQPVLFNNTKMYEKNDNTAWPQKEKIKLLEGIIKQIIELKGEESATSILTDEEVLNNMAGYFKGKRIASDFKCYEAIKRVVVTSDGGVWSCAGLFGNLRNDNLRRIWFCDEAAKVRAKIAKCKEHCLQDCVYYPSRVLTDMRSFIARLDRASGSEDELLNYDIAPRIEHYLSSLADRQQHSAFNFKKRLLCFKAKKSLIHLKRMLAER